MSNPTQDLLQTALDQLAKLGADVSDVWAYSLALDAQADAKEWAESDALDGSDECEEPMTAAELLGELLVESEADEAGVKLYQRAAELAEEFGL